jgi:hypothetical protein
MSRDPPLAWIGSHAEDSDGVEKRKEKSESERTEQTQTSCGVARKDGRTKLMTYLSERSG